MVIPNGFFLSLIGNEMLLLLNINHCGNQPIRKLNLEMKTKKFILNFYEILFEI